MTTIQSILLSSLLCAAPSFAQEAPDPLDRGRYLIQITGCNDCHTSGYIQADGDVAEDLWLLGSELGWSGPWGTTYPINLRLYMSRLTEAQWLELARQVKPRPPMPWFNLRVMTDDDLRAIYRYTRSLAPIGKPAPDYLPPDKEAAGPVVKFPQPPN